MQNRENKNYKYFLYNIDNNYKSNNYNNFNNLNHHYYKYNNFYYLNNGKTKLCLTEIGFRQRNYFIMSSPRPRPILPHHKTNSNNKLTYLQTTTTSTKSTTSITTTTTTTTSTTITQTTVIGSFWLYQELRDHFSCQQTLDHSLPNWKP